MFPGLFHLHQAFAAGRLMEPLITGKPGLLGQIQIVIGPDIVGIQFNSLFKFGVRLLQLSHFIEQLAILQQGAGLGFLLKDSGDFFQRLRIRDFTALGGELLGVLFLEGKGGGVFRIHLQHAADFGAGRGPVPISLRAAGELQPGGGQARNSLRFLAVDAGSDLLDQRVGVLVIFCSRRKVAGRDRAPGLPQLLAQNDRISLPHHPLVDGHIDSAVLRRKAGTGGQQEHQADRGKNYFCHGSLKVGLKLNN